MIKKIISILFLVMCVFGCEESDLFEDSNYPTTIHEIDFYKLSQRIATLHQENIYLRTSLNQFGFCDLDRSENDRIVDDPPVIDNLTELEAIEVIKDFISQNKDLTGVNILDNLSFNYSNLRTDTWFFKTTNQRIDTVEVIDSRIVFQVLNGELSRCVGNWYPEVYIPATFNFNPDNAKSLLVNKVITQYSMSGEYEETITQESLDESSVRLVIIPITTDDKIELRVSWQVHIPALSHKIYVDVMNGKILVEEPTYDS